MNNATRHRPTALAALVRTALIGGLTAALVAVPSVANAAAGWTDPVTVSPTNEKSSYPQVGTDAAGNRLVAWHYNDPITEDTELRARVWSSASSSWKTIAMVSEPGHSVWEPKIASSAPGKFTMVWRSSEDTNVRIRSSSTYDLGATWSTPVALSPAGHNAIEAQIASDASGTLIAVWKRYDGSVKRVQAAISKDDGATWGEPFEISPADVAADVAQIVSYGDDSFAVAWVGNDGAHGRALVSTSTDDGETWNTTTYLSGAGASASQLRISSGTDDQLAVMWRRSDGSDGRAQATISFNGGATWSTVATLSASGESAGDLEIASDSNGNTVAAWRRWRSTDYVIEASVWSATIETWSTPKRLNASGTGGFEPEIASGRAGQFVVLWEQGDVNCVQAAVTTNTGATWSAQAAVADCRTTSAWAQMTSDRAGNVIATWPRVIKGTWGIQVSVLTATERVVPAGVTVSGTAKVGETVTASTGAWSTSDDADPVPDITLTYQWYRETKAIAGATGDTYVIQGADKGNRVRVKVTGSAQGYKPTTAKSAYTSEVKAAPMAGTLVSTWTYDEASSTLTAVPTGLTEEGVSFKYRWYRNDTRIDGQKSSTYTLRSKDQGKQITVKIYATKAGYAKQKDRSDGFDGRLLCTRPVIGATAQVGVELSASQSCASELEESATPDATSYQWYRGKSKIADATGATYTPTAADLGKQLRVKVVNTKVGWFASTTKSLRTSAVTQPE